MDIKWDLNYQIGIKLHLLLHGNGKKYAKNDDFPSYKPPFVGDDPGLSTFDDTGG